MDSGENQQLTSDEPITDDKQINKAIHDVLLNIFCPNCQYNLRGLIGREVDCPECGHRCNLSELVAVKWDKPWYKVPGYDKLCLPVYVIILVPVIFFCCVGALVDSRINAMLGPMIVLGVYLLSYISPYLVFKSMRGIYLAMLLHLIAFGFFMSIPIFICTVIWSVVMLHDMGVNANLMILAAMFICVAASVGCFYSIRYARKWDRYVAQQCIDHYLKHFHDAK